MSQEQAGHSRARARPHLSLKTTIAAPGFTGVGVLIGTSLRAVVPEDSRD